MPKIYVIGGPNGSGKTTAAVRLLPTFLNCPEYINADAIAAALSLSIRSQWLNKLGELC